ncbi:MAG: tyrosine-protein phosphatase, partial [Candidatus Lokiarchaeia archaeon]
GHRPGYSSIEKKVPQDEVDEWIKQVKDLGVKSIICLLGEDQLPLYNELPNELPDYYRQHGFQVKHIPTIDYQPTKLPEEKRQKVWEAYQKLPKPVLVHCSAGIDRTGVAITYTKKQLKKNSP